MPVHRNEDGGVPAFERIAVAIIGVLTAALLVLAAYLHFFGTPPRSGGPSQPPATATVPKVPEGSGGYLWAVYRRSMVKADHTGDFSWKDRKAAARTGKSLEEYVIDGMDEHFRDHLTELGRALDRAGLKWTILSGFRDDYRQSIATGFKAHVGKSMHGGSRRTAGYGHGCAADIAGVDRDDDTAIQHFVDHHPEFGIFRPMKEIDPDHVQPAAGCAGVHPIHRRHHHHVA